MPLTRARPPFAWGPVLALAAAKVALHALTLATAWGYMTDELYFLDSAGRLAWGYVDHPPLSIAVLAGVRALLGESLAAVRALPALLGAAALVATALLARELGGGRAAQGLAALALLCSPAHVVMGSYYSMNGIDVALWPLVALLALRLAHGADARLWPLLGLALGLGLLNKLSVLWLGAGLAVALALTPERRWLATPWPYTAAALALACAAPFALWQARHGFPFLEFSRNAGLYKVGDVSPLAFANQQLLALNTALPLVLAGLWWCFARAEPTARGIGWIFATAVAILVVSRSARPHYLAPAYPLAFAAGAVAFEQLARLRPWTRAQAIALGVGGLVALPVATPVLPPDATARYIDALGLRPPEERERGGTLPMHLGLFFHAEALLEPLARVYAELSPEERARVTILTGSFGETGAVNVLGRRRGLPPSIGRHNQYWLWGPGDATGELVLVSSGSPEELSRWFASCERRAEIECPRCMEPMDAQAIFLCRGARRPLRELWPEMKHFR